MLRVKKKNVKKFGYLNCDEFTSSQQAGLNVYPGHIERLISSLTRVVHQRDQKEPGKLIEHIELDTFHPDCNFNKSKVSVTDDRDNVSFSTNLWTGSVHIGQKRRLHVHPIP